MERERERERDTVKEQQDQEGGNGKEFQRVMYACMYALSTESRASCVLVESRVPTTVNVRRTWSLTRVLQYYFLGLQ
jgi:hypothetical protein